MKHFLCSILLLLALLVSPSVQADNQIRIGWIGPLTGNSAVVGVDSLRAIQLVVDEVNSSGGISGRPIKLIFEDDSYQTERSLNAYKKLVHVDGAKIVFMQTYGALLALADAPLKDGVLVIDVLDCNAQLAALPENTLCVATETESIADGFAAEILRQKLKSLFILYEANDPWMPFVADETAKRLAAQGVKTLKESALSSESDFKSLLLRAKRSGVDGLVLLGNDQFGLAAAQARAMGLSGPMFAVGTAMSPGFQRLAAGAVEGMFISSWESPRTAEFQKFLDAFGAKYAQAPMLELASVPSYDAARIVIAALWKTVKGAETLDVTLLRTSILSTKNYPGLSGSISFDADGAVRTIKEKLYVNKKGQLVEIAER